MTRSFAIFAFCCVGTFGCAGSEATFAAAPTTTTEWSPTPAPPIEAAEDDPEPFDVRLAGMYPEIFASRERLCDLTFVGTLHGLRRDETAAYDPPISHRATVRCRAASGEGWADLVFPKTTASLAPFVRTESRIRVALRGQSGFHGYPVIEFVAQVSPEVPHPPRRRLAVPAGSDFDQVAEGLVRPCAIASIGSVEPMGPPGADESHRMLVTCRHPTGASTVEARFPRAKALAALRIAVGEVVPMRRIADDGHHVAAVYAGP
ncbi:MAG: hypothetical protein H6720_10935 [Sandaracinus sp.]|nr:hypothetical protein [Sandaracinus sp.]MCB9622612.1 hypothetical protein [Sandaracinus sp.]